MKLKNNIIKIWQNNDKIRFLIVGGYNSVFAYLIFLLLQVSLGYLIHYLFVLVIAHFISVTNSFFTLRFIVFLSKGKMLHEYFKVHIVYLGYLAANIVLLFTLTDILRFNVLLSQLFCIIILAILSYFLHKYFSFKTPNTI